MDRTRTLQWAASELAAIELKLITLRGAGPLSDDAVIHSLPAVPDDWRRRARFKGAQHEPETKGRT